MSKIRVFGQADFIVFERVICVSATLGLSWQGLRDDHDSWSFCLWRGDILVKKACKNKNNLLPLEARDSERGGTFPT